jgi:hypothetical protein
MIATKTLKKQSHKTLQLHIMNEIAEIHRAAKTCKNTINENAVLYHLR